MADEGLSNSELREQLMLYGVKHGPITASTRELLLKKLNQAKSGVGKPPAKEDKAKKRRSVATSTPSKQSTKLLAGFSSDEDKIVIRKSASVDSPSAAARRRSAFPRVTSPNDVGDYNNSEEKVATTEQTVRVARRRSLPRTHLRETKSLTVIPSQTENLVNDSSATANDEDLEEIEKSRPNYRKNSFDLEEESELVHKRKTRSFGTGQTRSSVTSSSLNSTTDQAKTKGWPRNTSDQTDSVKHEPENSNKEDSNDIGQDDEELDLTFAPNGSFLRSWRGPAFTIFVTILLICLVGSYMSLWSNRMSEWPELPELKDGSSSGRVSREDVFKMLQCLHEKLSLYAGEKECGYPNVTVKLNGGELGTFFSSECSSLLEEKLIDYEHLASQVLNFATDKMYSQFFRIYDERAKTGVKVNIETLAKITLSSKTAVRPLTCRIRQAAQMLSKYFLGIVIGLGLLLAAYYFMKRRWMLDDEDTRLMFIFVERIIETLRRHTEACQHDKELPAYLPIPHVRDMLIPPRERKQKSRAWTKAVDFLSSNDARIRLETQRIAGEDFDVWRWIGVMTSDKPVSGASNHLGPEVERGKFWQGQAFDKLEKVVRMPIITPTPCLKIRYLHGGPNEKEEEWNRHVRDALLEKCNDGGARILHVFVDAESAEGCVYVKCDSLDSSGKAFRSVYGNWFDGRLVIVKFVTLARYHQRFPDALTCTRPLKVSGDFPSSLSWNSQTDEGETSSMQS